MPVNHDIIVNLLLQSQYTKALSQSIRTERFRRKRKSLLEVPPIPSKTFSVLNRTVPEPSMETPSEEEYEKHVVELQKEWKCTTPSREHIKMLFEETFILRRRWLSTLTVGKVAPIIEKFPCFGEGYYVSRIVTSSERDVQ